MNEGDKRLRMFALEAIVQMVADMSSSPVPHTTIITRDQLDTLAEYVSRVKPHA